MYIDRCMDSNPRRMRQMPSRRVPDAYDMWPYGGNYAQPVPFRYYVPGLYSCRPHYPHYSPQPYPPDYHGVYPKIHEPYDVEYGPNEFYSEQPRKVYENDVARNYHCCACPEHTRNDGNTNFEIEEQNPKLNMKSCEQCKPLESSVESLDEVPLQKKSRNQVVDDKNMSSLPMIWMPYEENIQKSEKGMPKWKSPSNDDNENILGVVEDNFNRKNIPVKRMEPEEMFKLAKRSLSDEEAAVSIQCAYRGHMVRKWELLKKLKQIIKLREQAGDVAKSIQALQSSSDYLKDEKQKLIIGETIMSFLLKLDAIQGLPPSYREVRKSAVRELTKLQEMLDALTVNASEHQNGQNVGESDPKSDKDQEVEEIHKIPVESSHAFQLNEIPVAQFEKEGADFPFLSTDSDAVNRKLMEENAVLKEQMGKLIEDGKEKTTIISNLSERGNILERTLSTITSTSRPRRPCHSVFPY